MDPNAVQHNLRRWRTLRDKSQGEIADAAGISRAGYRNIETGETTPRVDTLLAIARALDVRLEDLLAPVRVLSGVRFRADKKMTTREELLADVSQWLDDYADLELLTGERAVFALTDIRRAARSRASGDARARAAADRVREHMKLDRIDGGTRRRDLIRDICGLLEDNGVKVLARPVASEGFFGLSVADRERGVAVVVNVWERLSVERWIFTAAHELGHLVLHHDAYDVSESAEENVEEKEADVFASQFLMPDDLFLAEWKETRGLSLVDRVFKLKGIFRVSWKTVLYRANTHWPDADLWARFRREYERETGVAIGPTEEPDGLRPDAFVGRPAAKLSEEPNHVPRNVFRDDRLSRLVREALERELITMDRAAAILRIDLTKMRSLANSWVE